MLSNPNKPKQLLDSNLFGQANSASRTLLLGSLLLSATLLALLLAGAAYCRAQSRRLLGSLASQPPPALLVASNYNLQQQQQQQQMMIANNLESGSSPPSSAYDTTTSTRADYSKAPNSAGQEALKTSAQARDCSAPSAKSLESALGGLVGAREPPGELEVPARLLLQWLGLQLTLLLMVLSQTFIERTSETSSPARWDSVGALTWTLVGLFLSLLASLLCWPLANLLRLAGCCLGAGGGCASGAPQGPKLLEQTNGGGFYAPTSNNLYHSGPPARLQALPQALQELARGARPADSAASSRLAGEQCAKLLELGLPLALAAALIYFGLDDTLCQSINQLSHSADWPTQLAHWPLGLECASSWRAPLLLGLPLAVSLRAQSSLLCNRRKLVSTDTNLLPPTNQWKLARAARTCARPPSAALAGPPRWAGRQLQLRQTGARSAARAPEEQTLGRPAAFAAAESVRKWSPTGSAPLASNAAGAVAATRAVGLRARRRAARMGKQMETSQVSR